MGYLRFAKWFVLALLLVCEISYGQVRVRGYYRRDGTYVAPHYRSAPDGNFSNNWSTHGNVNPFTGEHGTRLSPPSAYGEDVYVQGYLRQDGTYVSPHYRSAPDGNPWNNWSSAGNTNPYTGEPGRGYVNTPPGWGSPTVSGYPASSWDAGEAFLRGFADGRDARHRDMEESTEQMVLMLALFEALQAEEQAALLQPMPSVREVPKPAPTVVRPDSTGVSDGILRPEPSRPIAPDVKPARKKTVPGTVRIGIQSGAITPEVLEVVVTPEGTGTLCFRWTELGRQVSVVASDESTPMEVVRRYRAGVAGTRTR